MQVVYARAWKAKNAPAASPPRAAERPKAEEQGLELLMATQGSEPALDQAAESSPDVPGTDGQNAVRGSGVRKTRASSWRRRRAAKQCTALNAAAAQGSALPAGKLVPKVLNVLVNLRRLSQQGLWHVVAVSTLAGRQASEQLGEIDGDGPAAGGQPPPKAQASEESAARAAGQAPKGWLTPSNALLPRHGIFYSSTFSKQNGLPSSSEPSSIDSAH